jgi:hypothetical protein
LPIYKRRFNHSNLLLRLTKTLFGLTLTLTSLFHLYFSMLRLVGQIVALVLPFPQNFVEVRLELKFFLSQLLSEFIKLLLFVFQLPL